MPIKHQNYPLSLQQVFENAWQAFVVEKAPQAFSAEADGCAYRSDGGTKCAIGVSIPDSAYRIDFEGKRIGALASRFPEAYVNMFGNLAVWDLHDLQNCHDNAGEPFSESIERNLRTFAYDHNLTIPEAA